MPRFFLSMSTPFYFIFLLPSCRQKSETYRKMERTECGNDFSNALYYHTIDFFGILQYIFHDS